MNQLRCDSCGHRFDSIEEAAKHESEECVDFRGETHYVIIWRQK